MNKEEIHRTIGTLALAALVAFFVFDARWLLYAAVSLLGVSVLSTRMSGWVARGWMRFGALLGRLNTGIILSVVFFLVMTPLAFLYRAFSRTFNTYVRTRRGDSYFTGARREYTKDDFERPW